MFFGKAEQKFCVQSVSYAFLSAKISNRFPYIFPEIVAFFSKTEQQKHLNFSLHTWYIIACLPINFKRLPMGHHHNING